MKASEVYRKAAKMLEAGREHFPCWAVGRCAGGNVENYRNPRTLAGRFILTMAPGKTEASTPEAASDSYISQDGTEGEEHSILALCFMAAIAADEESAR